MDRLLAVCSCVLVAALFFGALGALYGAAVRLLAFLSERTPDLTYADAFWKGLKGGAVFMAVLGALLGAFIGFVEPAANARMQLITATVRTVGELMAILALGIAVPTTIVVWTAMKYRIWKAPTALTEDSSAQTKLAARLAQGPTNQSASCVVDASENDET